MHTTVIKVFGKLVEFGSSIPLLLLSCVVPKDKLLSVYGEWFGQRFMNESFDEYVSSTSERKVIIVKNRQEYERLKDKYDVRMAYSLSGLIAQLRADRAYVNVSSRDLALGAVFGATHYVQLGHGVPIKTFLLSEKDRGAFYRLKLRLKLRVFDRYTTVYCPFDYLAPLYSVSYAVPPSHVTVRAPRFKRFDSTVVRNQISYMPTHRHEGQSFDDGGFRMLFSAIAAGGLKREKVIVIRLHPYERKYTDQVEALIEQYGLVGRVSVNNAHEAVDEVVISDYSGVVFPFSHNGVPVILFQWDRETFTREFITPQSLKNILITSDVNAVLEKINEI